MRVRHDLLAESAAGLPGRTVSGDGRPDGDLAAELERAADGEPVDHAAAATWLLAAAGVAPDDTTAARLRMAAALRLVEADDPGRLADLHGTARAAAPGAVRSTVLGHIAGYDGDPAAVTYLESVLDDLSAPAELRALAGVGLAREHVTRARGPAAVTSARAAAALTGRSHRREQAAIWEAYGRAHTAGPHAGLRVVERVADTAVGARPALTAGILRQLVGDVDAAHRWLRIGLGQARPEDGGADIGEANIFLAEVLWRQGRWDRAAARAGDALACLGDGRRAGLEAAAHAAAALVPAARGDAEAARLHLDRVRKAAARFPTQQAAYAAGLAGAVLARSVAPRRALAVLGDLPRRAEQCALLSAPCAPWRVLHAEALVDAGLVDEAAERVAGWPDRDLPLWFALGRHRLRARVAEASGDDVTAGDALRAGLDLARADPRSGSCPVEIAELHLATGARLVRRGDPGAGSHLDAARAVFVALRATSWIARVDALSRTPAGPHPADVLTSRERQVASAVANGMTNAEVADELRVSRKTVEYHLGNVFRKLSVSSRRELHGRSFTGP